MFQTWLARVNLDRDDHQILTAEKLPALPAAVRQACADAYGIIADPRACTFRPSALRCPAGTDTASCLTAAQVDVVRARLYLIPGLYHCPCGQPRDGDPATVVDMMALLVRWVRDGVAPGTLSLPVTTGPPASLAVAPFDPTRPAPRNDGLNSNYHYVGYASTYRPDSALWCRQDGPTLRCTR